MRDRLLWTMYLGFVVLGLVPMLARAEAKTSAASEARRDEPAPRQTPEPASLDARVEQLVQQLSSPLYVERRQAEQSLLEIGLEAFDQIDAAAKHADPEVAASCRWVLGQLTINWANRDDPPLVQQYLEGFGRLADEERVDYVEMLAQLPNHGAVPALCRIARYDRTPVVSGRAAAAVMAAENLLAEFPPALAERIEREVGQSPRPAARWLRNFALQLRDSQQSLEPWRQAIAAEATQRNSPSFDDESAENLRLLQWNLLRLELATGQTTAALGTLRGIVQPTRGSLTGTLQGVVRYAIDHQLSELTEGIVTEYQPRLVESKEGLYLLAMARLGQNKADEANTFSRQALATGATEQVDASQGVFPAVRCAAWLVREGRHDWAIAEYRQMMAKAEKGSATYTVASYYLSDLLHDRQQDAEAATVMATLNEVIQNDRLSRARYARLQRSSISEPLMPTLPTADDLLAREAFLRACAASSAGDTEAEWAQLEAAYDKDDGDADVLIAMYRASANHAERRQQTIARIDELRGKLQQQIEDDPEDPVAYNHWAWLVSNTEGDFAKAVRYSQQSLAIMPDTAGFLDTLGRCYFAAGELDKALETQRRAVELEPHTAVLRRQLEEFERAASERPTQSSNTAADPTS